MKILIDGYKMQDGRTFATREEAEADMTATGQWMSPVIRHEREGDPVLGTGDYRPWNPQFGMFSN